MNNYPFPNLFIPGVQKAGTTALASFLAQHPDICLVEGKEAHVFDDPEFHASSDKHEYARHKYASKLTHYNGERYILDATPITMLHPAFIKATATYCPNAKYIVMLRDPIERALSHYAMTKARGLEALPPEKAFWRESSRMKGFYDTLPLSPFESLYRDKSYLIRGRYKQQLSWLYSYAKKQNVKTFQQDQLLGSHGETLAEIFSFLKLGNITVDQKRVFSSDEAYSLPIFFYWLLKAYFYIRR